MLLFYLELGQPLHNADSQKLALCIKASIVYLSVYPSVCLSIYLFACVISTICLLVLKSVLRVNLQKEAALSFSVCLHYNKPPYSNTWSHGNLLHRGKKGKYLWGRIVFLYTERETREETTVCVVIVEMNNASSRLYSDLGVLVVV